jgi:hypothetical protein
MVRREMTKGQGEGANPPRGLTHLLFLLSLSCLFHSRLADSDRRALDDRRLRYVLPHLLVYFLRFVLNVCALSLSLSLSVLLPGWGTASALKVSFSFWVYASIAGMYSVSVRAFDVGWSCATAYTVTTPNTWSVTVEEFTEACCIARLVHVHSLLLVYCSFSPFFRYQAMGVFRGSTDHCWQLQSRVLQLAQHRRVTGDFLGNSIHHSTLYFWHLGQRQLPRDCRHHERMPDSGSGVLCHRSADGKIRLPHTVRKTNLHHGTPDMRKILYCVWRSETARTT